MACPSNKIIFFETTYRNVV